MTFCNFPLLDEPIFLNEHEGTVLSIEPKEVYAKIVYSLYQKATGISPDYPFLLFDDNYKEIPKATIIHNPMLYDLNTLALKKALFQRIIDTMDVEERISVEKNYANITNYFKQEIFEDVNIEVAISESYKLESLFKLLQIDILDETASIFEKSQLVLNVLHELGKNELVIFCGLSDFLVESEYELFLETANFNQQQILLIERNRVQQKNTTSFFLDNDFVLWKD